MASLVLTASIRVPLGSPHACSLEVLADYAVLPTAKYFSHFSLADSCRNLQNIVLSLGEKDPAEA